MAIEALDMLVSNFCLVLYELNLICLSHHPSFDLGWNIYYKSMSINFESKGNWMLQPNSWMSKWIWTCFPNKALNRSKIVFRPRLVGVKYFHTWDIIQCWKTKINVAIKHLTHQLLVLLYRFVHLFSNKNILLIYMVNQATILSYVFFTIV